MEPFEEPGVAEVVKARRFEVVDAAGKVRAALGLLPLGEAALVLYEGSTRPSEDAAGKVGTMRAILHLDPDGRPFLRLLDAPPGKAAVNLGVRRDGMPDLVLWDPAGNQRVSLSVTRHGPALILWDAAAQKPVWQAP